MTRYKSRFLFPLAALLLLLTSFGQVSHSSYAQGASRTFPETGKTVNGRFLEYWDTHGGLAQQGYPISDSMSEVSDTDGKTYNVQYFERAVFEAHPEKVAPNDVLLSLLGVFLYKQKYPNGAPGQAANTEANSHLFPETGKHAGGLFLTYWNTHGGLAQQGFPISEEFNEISDLNGQTYKVQYFERAVFEVHPENPAPYNVLLSQLGTFRYRAKYQGGPKPGNTPAPPAATNTPSAPPATNTPTGPQCDTSANRNGSSTPSFGKVGDTVVVTAQGFQPNEDVSFWLTTPSGIVVGTAAPVPGGVNPDGTVGPLPIRITSSLAALGSGRWAITFQGASSNNTAVIYFCVIQ